MKCKRTGRPFGHTYETTAVEVRQTSFVATPDGTGHVYLINGGTYCSPGCALADLLPADFILPGDWPYQRPPCMPPTGEEPF